MMLNLNELQLDRTIKLYDLSADQIFNMDEKGIMLGLLARAVVIARRGDRGFQVQGTSNCPFISFCPINFASQMVTGRM